MNQNCQLCGKTRSKVHMIHCSLCIYRLESINLSTSSDWNLICASADYPAQACNDCVQQFDFCINIKSSQICKNSRFSRKLNCSTNTCANSHKTNILISKKWTSGFYGYKINIMNRKQIKILSKQTDTSPRKIGNDWYRIFCPDCILHMTQCTVDNCNNWELNGSICINHNQCQCVECGKYFIQSKAASSDKTCGNENHIGNKCGYNDHCSECAKRQHIGQKVMDIIQKDINNDVKYNTYIRQQTHILYGSTIDAIKSRFCDGITYIIFSLCIGYNIGVDLMCSVKCSLVNHKKHTKCIIKRWESHKSHMLVFPGIAPRLYAIKVRKCSSNMDMKHIRNISEFNAKDNVSFYYMVNHEYVRKLLVVRIGKKINRNNKDKLRIYGIHLIHSNYYRIFCSTPQLKICSVNECNNAELTEFCWNHTRCKICNNYVLVDPYLQCFNKIKFRLSCCKYCNNVYHERKCGNRDQCCSNCSVKYAGIIKSYNHKTRNGKIQIRGKINEFSNYKLLLPLIHKLNDLDTPTNAQKILINSLKNMFEIFATNNDNTMSVNDLRRYILHCVPKRKETWVISRATEIFSIFSSDNIKITLKEFICFYADAILDRPQHVINDLSIFGFKEDVLSKASDECVTASFKGYKHRRRHKHRLVKFEIIINDNGSKHAINIKSINCNK